ncbi:MAG: hypothetical protein ACJAT6_000501 [Akkermansiaceae bacterium]
MVNVAVTSNNDGRLVTNAITAGGANSRYQMVGFDAFGSSRDERRYHSFNFFARGDGTSTQVPSSANRRWLAVVDGSTKKVLYNQVLPDSFGALGATEISEIREAVNRAEIPEPMENFAFWAEAQISVPGLRAEEADPDFDGMTNLFEYAYGSDPMVSDSDKGPRIVFEEGLAKLHYQRSLTAEVAPLSIIGGNSPSSDSPFDLDGLEDVGTASDGVESVTVTLPPSLGSRFFLSLTTSAL